MKKKGRKLVSIMIILNIWDEIYLRICFLGDDSTKIVAAIATSLSLSLSPWKSIPGNEEIKRGVIQSKTI